MKGSESQKWSVNFIDGYFEYILSLYKKEESSPKCYMDLLIIISDAIDYLKDPVWEEVGYSICKKYRFLCKCNTYNGQMTSSASISGFLFGNAADIYPDQAFSCFVGKTVQFASVGYKVSGFPAWIMLHSLKQRSAVLLESQNMVLDSSVEPLYWEHHSDSLHTDIRKTAFYQRSQG